MIRYKDLFLAESFKNLFDKSEKLKWVDEVWDILQESYKRMGGIKGTGFESKEAMVAKIPMWKLSVKDGKVVAIIMYKDKGGRKSVALGTDKSTLGKNQLINMLKMDMKRSFGEFSGPALAFIQHHISDYKQYLIPAKDITAITGKRVTVTGEYTYTRSLGGSPIEKMAMGTTKKPIIT